MDLVLKAAGCDTTRDSRFLDPDATLVGGPSVVGCHRKSFITVSEIVSSLLSFESVSQ